MEQKKINITVSMNIYTCSPFFSVSLIDIKLHKAIIITVMCVCVCNMEDRIELNERIS